MDKKKINKFVSNCNKASKLLTELHKTGVIQTKLSFTLMSYHFTEENLRNLHNMLILVEGCHMSDPLNTLKNCFSTEEFKNLVTDCYFTLESMVAAEVDLTNEEIEAAIVSALAVIFYKVINQSYFDNEVVSRYLIFGLKNGNLYNIDRDFKNNRDVNFITNAINIALYPLFFYNGYATTPDFPKWRIQE